MLLKAPVSLRSLRFPESRGQSKTKMVITGFWTMITWRFLLVICIASLSHAVNFDTVCHQLGWWTLTQASRTSVAALLPEGFTLAAPNASTMGFDWPSDRHPIMLEMQTQSNCTESYIPFIHTTFHEFKLEIPFVTSHSEGKLFMFKPLLYADTWTDWLGARTEYGLNIHKAGSISQSDDTFLISYEHDTFNATFRTMQPFQPVSNSSRNFEIFENITALPWLCKGGEKCAYNVYDVDKERIRPVNATIQFGASILPDLGIKSIDTVGIDQAVFGSVQLDTILHISQVTPCPT